MLQQSLIQRNQPETTKQRLFRLFHTLLHHHSIHTNFYGVILILEIIQLIYYGCHSSFAKIWPNQSTEILQSALSFTDLSGIWRATGEPALFAFASLGIYTLT